MPMLKDIHRFSAIFNPKLVISMDLISKIVILYRNRQRQVMKTSIVRMPYNFTEEFFYSYSQSTLKLFYHNLLHCTYISKHIIFISAVTNAVSWRTDGVKYRKNEVFLDVIESVNLLAGASGNVLRSEIVGAIKMRVYLSGMPELRLGLNDKVLFESTGRGKSKSVELEDTKFHQCVRLSRFDNDRTISFIPPDGEFELMSYRLNTHVS